MLVLRVNNTAHIKLSNSNSIDHLRAAYGLKLHKLVMYKKYDAFTWPRRTTLCAATFGISGTVQVQLWAYVTRPTTPTSKTPCIYPYTTHAPSPGPLRRGLQLRRTAPQLATSALCATRATPRLRFSRSTATTRWPNDLFQRTIKCQMYLFILVSLEARAVDKNT